MTIVVEDDETYHASEGISKSGLWTLYTKTPFHYKFGVRKETSYLDLGKAAHCAVLEPERFETSYYRGPDDRRGNKWKEAQDYAAFANMDCLTAGDYDFALILRDTAMTCDALQIMLEGETVKESSAYHTDEETGVTVRCRPDLYNRGNKLIVDLKFMADGSPGGFQSSVGKFGYHVQDPLYSDVWAKAGGGEVEGFFFVVIEKSEPPMVSVIELDAAAVAEGHAIYRKALAKYAECVAADRWPGYPTEVQQIGLRRYDYRETEAPRD